MPLGQAAGSLMAPSTPVADWCSNLAFSVAKEKKTNPAKLASEWASSQNVKWPSFIAKAEAVGPYVNFHFAPSFWTALLSQAVSNPSWGRGEPQASKVLVEFPSVNPNKPWHVGHLRNALLGDSIARLLSASGRTAERMDYIDDLGLQVAQSVWGEKRGGGTPERPSSPLEAPSALRRTDGSKRAVDCSPFSTLLSAPPPVEGSSRLSGQPFASKPDHVLGRHYVEVAKRLNDPQVEEQVRSLLKQMEEGHEPVSSSARSIVESCVKAQYQTAFRFGICHDALIFESDIVRTIFNEGLSKIIASGAAVKETEGKNAGCLVVRLTDQPGFEGMEHADKVLIRSDGTATYTCKDVAFQLWKFGLLEDKFVYSPLLVQPNGQTAYKSSRKGDPFPFARAQAVVNVIGAEQIYPQKVISAVMRRMGFGAQAEACIHLAYEHVVLPEGRFSGRAGTWMAGAEGGPGFTADELLYEMRERAMEKITAENYSAEEKQIIAEGVAVSAIRFWFLRPSAMQKITFDYEKALSFSGDSGPYIQYAYARAGRILEKAKEAGIEAKMPPADYAFNEKEIAILRLLLRWPSAVEHSASKYQVHPIADCCLDAAGKFNEFYTTTPVLGEKSGGHSPARLMMVAAARALLGQGMDILGLPKLEKM